MTAEYRIRRIRTEEDYDAALARISELFQAETGTPDGDERDVLVDLVEMYEEKHHPIGYPSPIAAIEFRMDQAGLTPRDLVPYIGSRARVSEVLSGKRAITMAMARALHETPWHTCRGPVAETGGILRRCAGRPRSAALATQRDG